jgi:hypothetical protein
MPASWSGDFQRMTSASLVQRLSPMTGPARCCAPAATGHAAALPSSVMNWRRLMWDMDLQRVSIGNTAQLC